MTQGERQRLMAVLAKAEAASLQEKWQALAIDPLCSVLRGPETGLIGVKGHIGGGGDAFNFGEATITRITVRLRDSGHIGHAVHLGRDTQKVKLAAILDALAQDATYKERIFDAVITPLEKEQRIKDKKHQAQVAATKVDFFTLARGDE